MKRLSWHWIHSFIGMWCSLILFFIFLTGTLAIFATEIDYLLRKEMRVSAEGREKIAFAQIYDSVRAVAPDDPIVRIHRHDQAWIADSVTIRKTQERRDRTIWVDPYTATVKGETSIQSFHEIIGGLHTRLFIPGRLGIMAVTVFSLVLTAALVAGIMLLPRFWKTFTIRPRWSGSGRALMSDLHRLGGAWSLLVLIPICVTALYYFAETLELDAPPFNDGTDTEKRATTQPSDMSGETIAQIVNITHDIYPGLEIKSILLPRWPVKPIIVQGQLTATLVRDRANAVYLHPDTLAVIKHHRGEELTAHQRISEAVDPIHWGYWGGTASRALWLILGIVITALPLLGAAIYAKRMGVRIAKLEGAAISGWRVYWRGMGLGKWGALALIALGLALMIRKVMA